MARFIASQLSLLQRLWVLKEKKTVGKIEQEAGGRGMGPQDKKMTNVTAAPPPSS